MLYIISFLFQTQTPQFFVFYFFPNSLQKSFSFLPWIHSNVISRKTQNIKKHVTPPPPSFSVFLFGSIPFILFCFLLSKPCSSPPLSLSFRLIPPSPNSTVQWLSPAVLDFHSMFISTLPERIFRLRNWPLATWLAIFFFSLNLQYTLSSNFLIFRLPNCFSTSQGSEVQLREEDISN